jgi:glycosyltransferase involved in cell wall biosynthesis
MTVAKKRLIYIGNQLKERGLNPTTIDVLGEKFKEIFEVQLASNKKNPLIRLLDMLRLIYVQRKESDYVLIDTYSTFAFNFALLGGILCNVLRLKYIIFLHGGDMQRRYHSSFRRSNYILKKAFIVVSPSEYLADLTMKTFKIEVRVIPNMIDIETYPFVPTRRQDGIHIFWLRALQEIYNPLMALNCLGRLRDNGFENLSLTMVGGDKSGMLNELRTKVSAMKLDSLVKLTGQLSKNEWIEESNHANIFINTSTIDNTPVSIIEAMTIGLPVVSTNVGGIKNLLINEKNALLVENNDDESMANQIQRLIKDEELRNSLVLAARLLSEQFAWDKVKVEWLKILS